MRKAYTKEKAMRSFVVMILLVVVGCGGVAKSGRVTALGVFMTDEEQIFDKLLGDAGVDAKKDDTEEAHMDTLNNDFLAWMTLQPPHQGANDSIDSIRRDMGALRRGRLGRLSLDTEDKEGLQEKVYAAWKKKDEVSVGVLLPISGDLSEIGKHLWQSSLLVLHHYSDREDIALFLYDTKGSKQGVREAFYQASRAGVDIILGPFLSSNLEEIRKIKTNNIPIVSFSNNNLHAGNGVYIFGYTPDQQLTVLLDYVFLRGKERLAVLLPKTLYGRAVKQSLDDVLLREGVSYERLLVYDPSDREIQSKLRDFTVYSERRSLRQQALNRARQGEDKLEIDRLKKRDTLGEVPFDSVLLVAGDGLSLRTLSSQLSFLDIDRRSDVQFLGLQGWEDFDALNREPSLVGSWYVAPPERGRKTFEKKYQEVYKESPLRLATLAFELVLLVSTTVDEIKGGADLIRLLENPSGFVGIEGSYRFLASGRVERMMDIVRITNRGTVVEEQALPSFDLWDNQQRRKQDIQGGE